MAKDVDDAQCAGDVSKSIFSKERFQIHFKFSMCFNKLDAED